MTNSIVWNNNGSLVSDYGPAYVTFSLIEGGYDTQEEDGNINSDPCFATGPKGAYYLSQISAGQAVTSPCVDTGTGTSVSWEMDEMTTRTDEINDVGIVDMGFHHSDLLESYIPLVFDIADINQDGEINLIDFSLLQSQWQSSPSDPSADIAPPGGDGIVDIQDINMLSSRWLGYP